MQVFIVDGAVLGLGVQSADGPPRRIYVYVEVCKYISYIVKVCTLSQSTKTVFAQDGY